jgi:type II secretory pathway component GspD/PulD (secretin)
MIAYVNATKPGDVDKLLLGSDKLQTKAVLRVGSTLVLSGFKRMSSTTDARGLFKNQTLGSEAANTDTTETVILITPYISGV